MAIRERPAGPGEPTELIGPPPPGEPVEPVEPPPDRELWPWLLVLLVLVLAGLGAAWFATRDTSSASPAPQTRQTTVVTQAKHKPKAKRQATTQVTTVVVPDLVGQTRDEATHTLAAQGLNADVQEVPSTQTVDNVVSQHPAGGTNVDQNASVLLNVSKGPEKAAPANTTPAKTPPAPAAISVPDVTGQSVGAAAATLRSAGLIASVQHVPSTQPTDTVVSQSPGGGTSAPKGAHVLLNVSKGSSTPAQPEQQQQSGQGQSSQASVPSVVGENEGTARADLSAAGFTPMTVDQDIADQSQDGIVVDQSPTGGNNAPQNSQVTIYVGRYNGG
jgi:serine/threonine-protein kinase